MLALMNGLARGPFNDLLVKKMLNTLGKAVFKANQFIKIEEFNKIVKQVTRGWER